jgi:hypothetical protein
MDNEDSESLVTVYTTGNNAIIALIKSMLDEAEIEYYAKGDNLQNVYSIDAFPVEFQVMPVNEEFARELLKDVEVSNEIDSSAGGDSENSGDTEQNPEEDNA